MITFLTKNYQNVTISWYIQTDGEIQRLKHSTNQWYTQRLNRMTPNPIHCMHM